MTRQAIYWGGMATAIATVIAINYLPTPPVELALLAFCAVLVSGIALMWDVEWPL